MIKISSLLLFLILALGCSTVKEDKNIFFGTSDPEIESLEKILSKEKVFFTNNAKIKAYNSRGFIFDDGQFFTLDLETGALVRFLSSSPQVNIDNISDFTVLEDNMICSKPHGAESELIFYNMSTKAASSRNIPLNIQSVESAAADGLILYQGVYGPKYEYIVYGYEFDSDSIWGMYPARETENKIPFATRTLCSAGNNRVLFWEPFTDEVSVFQSGKIAETIQIELADYKADQEYWKRSGMNAFEYLQKRGFFAARTLFANENYVFFVGARVKSDGQELFLVFEDVIERKTFSKKINLGTSDEQFLNTFYQDSLGYFYSIVDGYTLTEKQMELFFPERSAQLVKDSYYLMKYSIQKE